MKFKGTLKSLGINTRKYKERLHEQLSEEVAQAAFLWLNAVLMEIPVWSGASRATFLRLSREVGYQLSVQPKVISRIGYGQRHSEGSVEADPVKGRYSFKYSTTLPHLVYNEYTNANASPDAALFYRLLKPGPYGFQEKGRAALEEFIKTLEFPSIWESLKTKNHKVS